MLENPTPVPAQPDSSTVVKRYAPPNQRNRPLNRRKSEKNQQLAPSRNIPVADHVDVGSSNLLGEKYRPGLIALQGCCRSEAAQLLNDRWAMAMHKYDDTSIDLSERPVMYSASTASAWGHLRLPHQFMPPLANTGGPSSGSQIDFLTELRRQMRNSNSDN
ncbi:uncharacterized protein [Euphorbia lathyris]|uniref:uncharacterized protein n=1 Tax=Euphorbia lathyris TaxID=212925 RepID=UPI003313C912